MKKEDFREKLYKTITEWKIHLLKYKKRRWIGGRRVFN
jgi:hypothetical protein